MSALDDLTPGQAPVWKHDGVEVEAHGLGAAAGPVIFMATDGAQVQTFDLIETREVDGEERFIIRPRGRTVTDGMREAIREAGGRIER